MSPNVLVSTLGLNPSVRAECRSPTHVWGCPTSPDSSRRAARTPPQGLGAGRAGPSTLPQAFIFLVCCNRSLGTNPVEVQPNVAASFISCRPCAGGAWHDPGTTSPHPGVASGAQATAAGPRAHRHRRARSGATASRPLTLSPASFQPPPKHGLRGFRPPKPLPRFPGP